jgi:hypothetical protein
MTFVGQVPQGSVTNTLQQGFNLISSIIPQTGALDKDLGLTPGPGDIAFTFVSGLGYNTPNTYESVSGQQFWNAAGGASPTNTVGLGFFYYSASATPNSWTRTFNIN